jgi:hypothetical protein
MQFIAPILKELGYLDNLFFNVAVVGSRKLGGAGDIAPGLIQTLAPNLAIYGFDPIPMPVNLLTQKFKPKLLAVKLTGTKSISQFR